MHPRQQSWPRVWLMTDERMGDRLLDAVERLPGGAGVVLRHYSLAAVARRQLANEIASAARRRGLVLGVAADVALAFEVGADLVHNPSSNASELQFSRSVHSIAEAEAARVEGAALVFVSPVYPTRSHPGLTPLGAEAALEIAKTANVPAIALGGMNAQNFERLEGEGFHGWAGIDAWLAGGG